MGCDAAMKMKSRKKNIKYANPTNLVCSLWIWLDSLYGQNVERRGWKGDGGGGTITVFFQQCSGPAPNTPLSGLCPPPLQMFQLGDCVMGTISPTHNFEPPHYDGIECLAIQGDILFSGSRDNGIKKWDLDQQELIQVRGGEGRDGGVAQGEAPGRP